MLIMYWVYTLSPFILKMIWQKTRLLNPPNRWKDKSHSNSKGTEVGSLLYLITTESDAICLVLTLAQDPEASKTSLPIPKSSCCIQIVEPSGNEQRIGGALHRFSS